MVGAASELFIELGIIFIIAAFAAYILRLFRQPQVLAYVLVGILITPVLHLVTETSIIESMSLIGIAFLLFIVGIEIDLKRLKHVALVSTLGGVIQIAFLFILGYLIALLLGFLSLEAAYIGLMLSFSSTMVVMKLLSDKRELDTLHGRIVVGILLLEDIIAIFAISLLTSVNGFTLALVGLALLKFLSLFAVAFLCSKLLFPRIFRFAARNQELLLITSLGVCFLFSLAFHYLGFSIAIGAFLAGVTLGNLTYNIEIVSKVKSLRDFFALLFFVSLGMGLSLAVIKKMWVPLVVLILFILIVKPFIIMVICSLFKYTKKPAFLTAISLSQMGEFSLIIASQGLLLGHISQDLFSLIVVIVLTTITITSYLIKHDHWFYQLMEKPLRILDIFNTRGMEYVPDEVKNTIVLCGYNRVGYSILKGLKKSKKKILVVDYNPEIISKMAKEGYHCIYGDVGDEEILEKMNLSQIRLLVSTVPELNDNLLLIKRTKKVNKKAKIIVTSSEIEEALSLYKAGADYVVMPHFLGGEHASHLIEQVRKRKIKLDQEKEIHIG
ncbi:MAG: cation:proton antiporter, partial [Candidatus Woesearchaeota archaeon]